MFFFTLLKCTYIKGKSSWESGKRKRALREKFNLIKRYKQTFISHIAFFLTLEGITGEKHAVVANLEKFKAENIRLYKGMFT